MLELLDGCSTIGESSRVNITTIIVIVTMVMMTGIELMLPFRLEDVQEKGKVYSIHF